MSNLPAKQQPPSSPSSSWRSIAAVVLAVYALIFLFLNNDQVQISFVFFKAETSLIFLVLLSMGLGAALATFGPAWWRRRQRLKQMEGSKSS